MACRLMKKNCFLVNAPAGSGKTTTIRNMIKDILYHEVDSRVLGITYTNRAAEELTTGLDSSRVNVHTIHSFISSFMKIYFSHKEILDCYFLIYEEKIKKRIENAEGKDNIKSSNETYIKKYGELSFESIKRNIDKIDYNELPFNTLYYGGLGHDDLLSFSKYVIDTYPKILNRLNHKYQYIFIDEFQDTSANVLDIFYQAVRGTETKLYLFGDKMQQIYKNYDGTFEEKLKIFDTTKRLDTNYRSSKPIVTVLNNIYNDANYIQKEYSEDNSPKPRVFICRDIHTAVANELDEIPKALRLYVFNRQRFNSIGAGNLYTQVDVMDKYGFGKKYSATDVLTKPEETADKLFKMLFLISDIYKNYKEKKYGTIIQKINKSSILSMKSIDRHTDKNIAKGILGELFISYCEKTNTIKDLMEKIKELEISDIYYIDQILEDEDYNGVINVKLEEFISLVEYLDNPTVSTQHGVKGEGYDNVFFVAEDSTVPSIKIYKFLNLFANLDVCFTEFQDFYYQYKNSIEDAEKRIGIAVSKLKRELFKEHEGVLTEMVDKLLNDFKDNQYFNEFVRQKCESFLLKPGVGRIKDCFKINSVYGVLSAYKLFYVGCSRAKKSLTVFIDENSILGDKEKLISKLVDAGFVYVDK